MVRMQEIVIARDADHEVKDQYHAGPAPMIATS